MKLTSANVALPKGKSDHIVFDDRLRGFGLRVRRLSGDRIARNWIIQYRQHGRGRRMIIGDAEKITPAQARDKAKKELAKVELGGDPQADKRERREKDSLNLRGVIAGFIAAKARSVKPSTLTALKRYLEGPLYIRPLHSMPVDKITRKDIASRLGAVERDTGAPTAIALKGALSSLFVWSMQEGLVENNPLIGARKLDKPPSRDRVLTDAELTAVWKGVEGDGDYAACIRLIICTACRREEIGGLRWSEFSDDGTSFTIPAERSKSKRAHTLPVTPLMREIIDSVPRRDSSDHLFGRKGFTPWSYCKAALDERLDLQPWRHHDLRRTVSTRMNDLNIAAPHVIEKILGHSIAGTHGIYNKSQYANEVRNAMLRWSDHVTSLISGKERKVLACSSSAQLHRRRE